MGVQFFFYCLCVGGESDAEIFGGLGFALCWGDGLEGDYGRYGGPIS